MLAGVLREITPTQLGICQQNLLDCLQPTQHINANPVALLFHNFRDMHSLTKMSQKDCEWTSATHQQYYNRETMSCMDSLFLFFIIIIK